MNVWCHLPTIFSRCLFWLERHHVLRFAGLMLLCAVLTTTLVFARATSAVTTSTNRTINFQGRLLTSGGAPVADGFYNIQFKIYQGGNGNQADNPGGSLKWTETYVNNNADRGVEVKNGVLSVELGSQTPFDNSIDWNHDTLWLSMNVAGSAKNCTVFDSAICDADGEMLPMKRLTATPYAINSGMLEGRDASGFIQNGTALQPGSFNISGIGRAAVLQGTAGVESAFFDRGDAGTLSIGTVNATSIEIGSASGDQTINIGTGDGNKALTIGSNSGESHLSLQGGTSGVTVNTGGNFVVHNPTTDRDTLVIGSDGSTSINLSDETDFVVNDGSDNSVFQVGSDGSINTGSGSNLAVNGGARFKQGATIGDGNDKTKTAFLTLDSAKAAPDADEAPLGSMYYDTTLGKIQCYEADGWGACSSSPDTFVTLSPEYSNAVTNGTGLGTLSSDICSDELNLNDGSDDQALVCSKNETYNFYDWTSTEATGQTKSIYVSYQLPDNFKKFVKNSTSLMSRTNSTDASVKYQIYQKTTTGLVACGTAMNASNGIDTAWKKTAAKGANDPTQCDFEAGDSIVFKIDFTAANDAHAYVSDLSFAFSNN